jgi:hypothetical protein
MITNDYNNLLMVTNREQSRKQQAYVLPNEKKSYGARRHKSLSDWRMDSSGKRYHV